MSCASERRRSPIVVWLVVVIEAVPLAVELVVDLAFELAAVVEAAWLLRLVQFFCSLPRRPASPLRPTLLRLMPANPSVYLPF